MIQRHNFFQGFASIGRVDLVYLWQRHFLVYTRSRIPFHPREVHNMGCSLGQRTGGDPLMVGSTPRMGTLTVFWTNILHWWCSVLPTLGGFLLHIRPFSLSRRLLYSSLPLLSATGSWLEVTSFYTYFSTFQHIQILLVRFTVIFGSAGGILWTCFSLNHHQQTQSCCYHPWEHWKDHF